MASALLGFCGASLGAEDKALLSEFWLMLLAKGDGSFWPCALLKI
jgi:hypothetical protein